MDHNSYGLKKTYNFIYKFVLSGAGQAVPLGFKLLRLLLFKSCFADQSKHFGAPI